MQRATALGCFIPLLVASAPPQTATQGDLTDKIVNDPRPEAFRPYGSRLPARIVRDKKVQFGKALRIPVDRAEPEDWRVGLTIPVLKPIKAGNRIVVAFWARAEGTEGGAPGKIARVQLEAAPPRYRQLFALPFVIGPDWKMYQLTGKVDQDYAPEQLNVAMHLAAAKQAVEVGPVFVLRYDQ